MMQTCASEKIVKYDLRAKFSSLSKTAFCVCLSVGLVAAVPDSHAQAPQHQSQTTRYDIPAGTLDQALNHFAATTGILLAIDGTLTSGKTSAGLRGNYSLRDGLAALLAGTGLETVQAPNGSYSLRRLRSPAVTGEQQMSEIKVRAEASRSTTTEGTGSYTTPATAAATGLDLSLRETPQSVSVVTRQRIEDQGLNTVTDILSNAPGIGTLQLDSERTTFAARGFSIDNFQYDGISTYYKSNYAAGESDLDSVVYDRVEIVRGATGLLTGAGEPSASINLVRKRADSKVFKGEASVSAGSWQNYRSTVDLSMPVTEDGRIRARVVAAHEDKESFIDRYQRKRTVVYATVDADLTPATTLSVGASQQESDAQGITYGGVPLWYSDGSPTNFDRSFSVAPKWNTENVQIQNVFLNLDHQFDNGWTSQARLMHGRHEVDNARLFVWGYPDRQTGLLSETPSRVRYPGSRTQDSADLKLSGPFELAGRKHEAIFGLNYFDHEYSFDRIGATSAPVPLSVYNFGAYPEPTWGNPVLSEKNHTTQSASYGAVRLSLSDSLKLIAGGRLSQVDRDGAGYNGANRYSYSKSKFIPYAGLVYDLNASYSAYTSYTSIFNHQDFRDRNGNWLEPVIGDAYEAGLKAELLNGKVNASVALFKIIQDNLGQTDGSNLVPGTTTQAYYAAQGATSRGIEAELSGEIARGWNLFFFATRFNAEDATGKEVNTYLPRTMWRVFTTYRLPGEWQKLTIGGGANWQSRIYYDIPDGPLGLTRQEQTGYMIASLMARYQISPKLSLQMNLNNLFDKTYQTAVNWYGQGSWGAPRNFMATLAYKF